jgi:DNA-binding CsgD family transcriptional regulator
VAHTLASSSGLRLAGVPPAVARAEVVAALAESDAPELHLAMGLLCYLSSGFVDADRHLQTSYLAFRDSGRPQRAALVAAHLARVHQDGIGNSSVANGWLGRAERLVAHEGDCIERGWVLLPYTGCNVLDPDDLARRSEEALDIARRYDDVDLECKALADFGLALMLHGRTSHGQTLLDESMTMAQSGECDNMFVIAQIRCCLISACERTGDLARLEEWLVATRAAEPHVLGPEAPPNLTLGHCQSQFGTLLCHAGRWPEAEAALQRVTGEAESPHFHMRALARSGLALLRVEQGRLAEAGELLDGLEHRWEVQHPLARLHQARGDHDLAAAVARQAARALGSDHLRRPPLVAVLVEAELARGNVEGAREAAEAMAADVRRAPQPANEALARRAQAQLARQAGDVPRALALLEEALAALPADQWPLLAADLHLEMARTTADSDRSFAIAEARRALATFSRLGARRMREPQELLHALGDPMAAGPLLSGPVAKLTAREREILRLVAEGLSNPQIAERLVISPKTAEHHVGSILRKLQLTSRSEAAVYAATMA